MEPGKGQDLLVRAFAKVKKNVPAAQLRLIGAGGFCEVVEHEVSQLGLSDAVKVLGWVEDPLREVARASVCVFPSVWPLEGFGMVTIEAMALGKPIVAFKCGPTPYILTDGETGLLAEAGNSDALADHITRVLKDKTLAVKLGKNAQRAFQERYRFEHSIDQYIDVFAAAKAGQK
jgi:glycosyltransferase involved in cell wall biosynthesis